MDGCMDGEALIMCVAIWTLNKHRLPLICDDFRVIYIASQNKLGFASLRGAIFEVCGAILRSFERPKLSQTSIFPSFFRYFFRTRFWHRFFIEISRFFEAPNLENPCFSLVKSRIFTKSKCSKKLQNTSILTRFWEAETFENL